MNKIIRFVQNYLIIGLPFVIICMGWSTFYPEDQFLAGYSTITKMIWTILSMNLLGWFVVLILFLTLSVAVSSIREITITRLANLKERDEREQYITGKASRAAYISTLSLTLFFLFFSVFQLNIIRAPKPQGLDAAHHSTAINLKFHFSLSNKGQRENQTPTATVPGEQVIFDSENISLSPPAILLVLLCWQLLIFNLTARKELQKDNE